MIFSLAVNSFAAFKFPKGVNEQKAKDSAFKTDLLIENMLKDTQGKSLSELVMPTIMSDETLSQMLLSVYSSLSEQGDAMRILGIDISVENVANCLANYPSVASELLRANDWAGVNLENAKWGVKNKQDFANAFAAMLMPFNNLLYMLLCGGSQRVALLTIRGDMGYKNGIIPMLKALGCTQIKDDASFVSQAAENKNTMIYNIVLSIFSMLEKVLESPAVRLSETMPNLAHYIKNGGLEDSINALTSPLTPNLGALSSLLTGTNMLSVLMFVQDSEKYTTNFGDNFTTILNDALAETGFKLAELDLDKLASCGTLSGDEVIANIGEAYTVIFTWLIDTMKLNKYQMMTMLAEGETDISQMSTMIDTLFAKGTDEIFVFIIDLFTKKQGEDLEYQWQIPTFEPTAAKYTANLGKEQFQRVVDGMDDLLSDFVAESSDEKNISSYLKKTIYSSNLVSQLAVGLYSQLSGEDMGQMMGLLGMSFSPSAIAGNLTERQFASVRNTLYSYSSWKKINPERLNWGFKDGDKEGFINAVTCVLRPFEDVLRMLLVSDSLEIYSSINIGGSNGYNTAIIPLLEALGCPKDSIMTYDKFKKEAGGDGVIKNLLNPIFALVDKVIKKPVYTLTSILPNLVFFVSNGSATQCIENLISPVFGLLDEFSLNAEDLGLDLNELKNTDLLATIEKSVTEIEDLKLESPNLKEIAGLGEATTYQSKATYMGQPVDMVYIKADQTGVMAAIIRYIVGIISNPANSSLLDGMMGSGEGGGTFGEFSSGIGDQMASMSEDELIEWLYRLFFRERAVKEEPTTDSNYSTGFVYTEKEDKTERNFAPFIIILAVAIIVMIIIFRKQIFAKLKNIKFKKAEYVLAEEWEM